MNCRQLLHLLRIRRVRRGLTAILLVSTLLQACAGSVANRSTQRNSELTGQASEGGSTEGVAASTAQEPESSHKVAWTIFGISGGVAIIVASMFVFAAIVGAALAASLSHGHSGRSSSNGSSGDGGLITLPSS